MSQNPLTKPTYTGLVENAPLVVGLLLMIDSLHFIFARLYLSFALPPVASAMYVIGIGMVEIAVILNLWSHIQFHLLYRHLWFFLTIGFLAAVSTTLNYTAVAFIDPGTASLLSRTTILFGLGFGLAWLRERLTLFQLGGAAIAIGGVFIITFQPVDYLRIGSLMVLASTFMYALHAALVKRFGEGMRIADFFLFRLACTTGFLFLIGLARHELVWPGWGGWGMLLLGGTVSVMIGRGLYYLALRRLNLSLHSIALTLSPVATIIWTVLLFNVRPTGQQLVGGVAVLAGVAMVTIGNISSKE